MCHAHGSHTHGNFYGSSRVIIIEITNNNRYVNNSNRNNNIRIIKKEE